MAKIFLLGYDPPHFRQKVKAEAANYRTWQFLEPLITDGHHVCLCVDQQEPGNNASIPMEWVPKITYHQINFHRPGWGNALQQIHDDFNPDCIVASNYYPSLYATKLRTQKPFWLDIYGDMITILQAVCFQRSSNRGLPTTIKLFKDILNKGDIFSTCGTPQQHMLVGELAMAGRLNYLTFGYQFVRTILPGAAPLKIDTSQIRSLSENLGIPPDNFIILWAGGYNTWTDVHTLFKGLEWSIAHNPQIHYVSAGANTYDSPNNVYQRLQNLIENSQYRSHFHLLGWQPWGEIPGYYLGSNAGLNIDAQHYETIYGTRTRLLEMAAAGLPVITSMGSELSYLMTERGVAKGFEIGNWMQLGQHILDLSQKPDECKKMSAQALNYAKKDMSFSSTTAELRAWVKSPQHAPDNTPNVIAQPVKEYSHKIRATMRYLLWKLMGAER